MISLPPLLSAYWGNPPAPRLPKTQQVTIRFVRPYLTNPSPGYLLDQSLCCNTVYNFQGLCCDSFGKWCIVYIRKSHILNVNTNINQVLLWMVYRFSKSLGYPKSSAWNSDFPQTIQLFGYLPFRIPFFLDSLRWLIKNHEKWLTFDAVSIIPRKKALLMVKPRWIPRRARIDGSILPFPARLEDFRPDARRSHGDKARRSAMFKVAHG